MDSISTDFQVKSQFHFHALSFTAYALIVSVSLSMSIHIYLRCTCQRWNSQSSTDTMYAHFIHKARSCGRQLNDSVHFYHLMRRMRYVDYDFRLLFSHTSAFLRNRYKFSLARTQTHEKKRKQASKTLDKMFLINNVLSTVGNSLTGSII